MNYSDMATNLCMEQLYTHGGVLAFMEGLNDPHSLVVDHMNAHDWYVLGYDGSMWYLYVDVFAVFAAKSPPQFSKMDLKQVPASVVKRAIKMGLLEYFGLHIKSRKEFRIQKALGIVSCMRMARLSAEGRQYHHTAINDRMKAAHDQVAPPLWVDSSASSEVEITYTASM